jgi:hypothetical protein
MLARTPAALKKRRYRRRLRDGKIVLRLEVNECELAHALIASERLTERQTASRSELESATGDVLREWCARWRRHKS